jgi:hypothetical protein
VPNQIDEFPAKKPFYVYWIFDGKAEQQSEWLSQTRAYLQFREKVRDFMLRGPKRGENFEIGVYNAFLDETVTQLIHTPS